MTECIASRRRRDRARRGNERGPEAIRGLFVGVPSMTCDLEVQVLWELDRGDPSEPQGDDREGLAESSGERDPQGDVQQPDQRRGRAGRAGQ